MKKFIFCMMISFVGFAFLCRGADKYFVVKITNFAKQSEYKVLNEEELKNLQKEIADETRLWSKVITAAQKEWQSNEQYKGKSFPTGAIDKRTVKVIGQPYTDQSKAEDKISSIEEQEQEKAEKEAEREKEKAAKPVKVTFTCEAHSLKPPGPLRVPGTAILTPNITGLLPAGGKTRQ